MGAPARVFLPPREALVAAMLMFGVLGAADALLCCVVAYKAIAASHFGYAIIAVGVFGILAVLLALLLALQIRVRVVIFDDHFEYADPLRHLSLPFAAVDRLRRQQSGRRSRDSVLRIVAGRKSVTMASTSFTNGLLTDIQNMLVDRCVLRYDGESDRKAWPPYEQWVR